MTTNAYALRPTNAGEAPKALVSSAYARQSYAVPSEDDFVPGSEEGFSPALGEASEGKLPDEIRTQKREPVFGGPTQSDIHLRRGLDNIHRRDDEEPQISTGWNVQSEKPVPGVFPEQVQDVPNTRPTQSMGPNTYLFMRPWDIPGASTGEHLSMADHRRMYEIYGMKPQGGVGVNTYRLDPKPWDINLHYNPVATETPTGAQRVQSIAGNRSYRLG